MQQIQYFKSAWGDIRNSPGWFGKICLLALLNFIPVFGQIVTFGYLYGWSREIAWGVHQPMPSKIFSNDDGKFWRRGWFALVLTFVFALVPAIVSSIGDYWQGLGMASLGMRSGGNGAYMALGTLMSVVGFVLAIACSVFAWVGNMRLSIYDRLSAGFQLGKIWKMLRHDANGMLRIFGMYLIVTIVVGIVLAILFTVLMFLVVAVGLAGLASSGYSVSSLQHMTDAQAAYLVLNILGSAGLIGLISLLVGTFVSLAASVFVQMLVIRALGYWTMRFDVPHWGGQDEPMPFEDPHGATTRAPYRPESMTAQPQQPVDPAAYAAPAATGAAAEVAAAAQASDAAEMAADNAPSVEYDGPVVVGAEFFLDPDTISQMEAEAAGQPDQPGDAEAEPAGQSDRPGADD